MAAKPFEPHLEPLHLRLHQEQWPEHFEEDREYVAAFVVDKKGYFYFTEHAIRGNKTMILTPCCLADECETMEESIRDHVQSELDIDSTALCEMGIVEACTHPYNAPQANRHSTTHFFLRKVSSRLPTSADLEELVALCGMSIVKLPYEDAALQYRKQLKSRDPSVKAMAEIELPFNKIE